VIAFLLLVVGLALLVAGAELLVRGAASAALALGISPLVIGLTVVSYGTSAPELVTGVIAAARAEPGIVIGNVVGSNIFNVLAILGLAAVLAPLPVDRQLLRVDVPLMLALSLAVWLVCVDGMLAGWEGALLLAGILVYTVVTVRRSRRAAAELEERVSDGLRLELPRRHLGRDGAFVLAGLALLVWGAAWLVQGATELARVFGVSELVIGLTVVAAGTSLPELATSVVAALRRHTDIAVGNVVGSNIFNLLAVLGASATVADGGVEVSPRAVGFDLPIMVLVAAACVPVFLSGRRVERWEGVLFLLVDLAYLSWLLATADASAPPSLALVLAAFGLPLLGLTWLPWFSRRRTPADANRGP
jgi:cation:H+ antiporter